MKIGLVVFDQFTDLDVFLMWDLLKRVETCPWEVRMLGSRDQHVSKTGIPIPMHGRLDEASSCEAVLFTSGPGARQVIRDESFLKALSTLEPERQLLGSMCSGALVLAALGLLEGKTATTYPTTRALLEAYGVRVEERALVTHGNIATAAGCLAAQDLTGWVIERLVGPAEREQVVRSIQRVGEGLSFS